MLGAAAAGFFRRLQFVEPLAVGGEAAGDEQFGDQFVLGAEMIVHRREIDVGGGDDVAQRDVGKAAIGIKPLGGVQDRGSGLVRRHVMAPCEGRCNSNTCMKLWFEGWNVNAHGASPLQPSHAGRHRRAASAINGLAVNAAAGRQCRQTISEPKSEERPMDFNMSDRQREWLNRVQSFMHKHVRPAVPIYKQQDAEGARWKVIPVLEELKKKARAEGLGTCSCRRRRMRTMNSAARD